jgi:tetratricopeptide (TPR) repeat protein
MAARCYSMRKANDWMEDTDDEIAETVRSARLAADLGKDDAVALCTAGIGFSFVAGQHEDGGSLIDRALVLNPNLALAWLFSGWVEVWLGHPETALERVAHAMRLSPQDPLMFNMRSAMACAYFVAGQYDEALSWSRAALREHPNMLLAACVAAASASHLAQADEAETFMSRLRLVDPNLRLSNLKRLLPTRRQEDFARWADGLRKAGLPD